MYDYTILPGVIQIRVKGYNDVDILDITSELQRYDGKIYVEGYRYSYLGDYNFVTHGNESFIELQVVQT